MKTVQQTIAMAVVLVLACLGRLNAKTITVSTEPNTRASYYLAAGQPYATLNDLIQSAEVAAGDEVWLLPASIKYGDVTINKGITLTGNGHYFQPQTGNATLGTVLAYSSNITISGVQLHALRVNESSATQVTSFLLHQSHVTGSITVQYTVNQVHFAGNLIAGNISVSGGNAPQTDVVFNNNLIMNNAGLSIPAAHAGTDKTVLFVNNTIVGNGFTQVAQQHTQNTLFVRNVFAGWQFNTAHVQGNTFYHNVFTTMVAIPVGNTGSAADNRLGTAVTFENNDGNHQYNYGTEDLRLLSSPYPNETIGITDSYSHYGVPFNTGQINIQVVNPVVEGTDPLIINMTDNQQ